MFVVHKIDGMHSTITDILRIARIWICNTSDWL